MVTLFGLFVNLFLRRDTAGGAMPNQRIRPTITEQLDWSEHFYRLQLKKQAIKTSDESAYRYSKQKVAIKSSEKSAIKIGGKKSAINAKMKNFPIVEYIGPKSSRIKDYLNEPIASNDLVNNIFS